MCLKDLFMVLPDNTDGIIRNKNGYVICEGKIMNTDCKPNFPEENFERKVCTVMVNEGKLLVVVE